MPKKIPRGQRPTGRRPIPPRQGPARVTQAPVAEETAVASASPRTSRRPQPQPTPAKGPVDFAKEYHYVADEMRQTAILAGCIIVGLIVLSFIIH